MKGTAKQIADAIVMIEDLAKREKEIKTVSFAKEVEIPILEPKVKDKTLLTHKAPFKGDF